MDVLTKRQRSYCMSQIRGKNTKPEIELALIVRPLGLRLRRHQKLPGRPDLASRKRKIAIFIDGCFWHKCPKHYQAPKSNSAFWETKIESNVLRDRKADKNLRKLGFSVVRLWEHEISQPEKILRKIRKSAKLS